jgi:glycosyltransferase involved in cell wall biosynthesis
LGDLDRYRVAGTEGRAGIGIESRGLWIGGAARGLQARGHLVVCALNIRHDDEIPGRGTFAPLQNAGIETLSFPMQRLQKYGGMLRFRKLLSERRFDVVHAHRFRALRFVCTASLGMKIPALVGDRKNSYPIPPAWAKVYGRDAVDRIIVNAEIIRDLLLKTGRVAAHKIELVYNGVDLRLFHPGVDGTPIRRELGIDDDVPVFGMIANFAAKKSHDVFFAAAMKVLDEMPGVIFLLVGGGDRSSYEALAAKRGRNKNVIFTGFRPDIPQIIAGLDFSLISSGKGEGLTGSLVESMAMAKPVISTDVGANAEFVKNRDTGLLIAPGRADQLAGAMLYLLHNRAEAQAMGNRAYSFVKDKVDNEQRTRRMEQIYYAILKEKGLATD